MASKQAQEQAADVSGRSPSQQATQHVAPSYQGEQEERGQKRVKTEHPSSSYSNGVGSYSSAQKGISSATSSGLSTPTAGASFPQTSMGPPHGYATTSAQSYVQNINQKRPRKSQSREAPYVASGGSANSSAAVTPTSAMFAPTASSGGASAPVPSGSAAPGASQSVDVSGNNVDQLQDLLGMSGVDLKAEEEAIHGRHPVQPSTNTAAAALVSLQGASQQQTIREERPSPFFLELYPLSHRIHRIAARGGLRVEPELLMYISNAARLRFRNLVESMVVASRHRAWSSYLRAPPSFEGTNQPMYHEELLDDPHKLLSALTRVEKHEEQISRQRRMERDEREANAAAGIVDDDMGPGSGSQTPGGTGEEEFRRRGKKIGVSAAARNMTEDKRLKLANKTAAQALGISSNSKAWMFGTSNVDSPLGSHGNSPQSGAGGGSRLPKPRFAPTADGAATGASASASGAASSGAPVSNPGGWGDLTARRRHREEEEKRRARLVNLQDALHALDMERKGGAGQGSGEKAYYTTRALGRPNIPPRSM